MSKIRTVQGGGQIFWCPGCESPHQVNTTGPRWDYNGDPERPTFSPSILVNYDGLSEDGELVHDVCHSFVRDGQIQFLGDCTHKLAGETVPIPEWPYAPDEFGGLKEVS